VVEKPARGGACCNSGNENKTRTGLAHYLSEICQLAWQAQAKSGTERQLLERQFGAKPLILLVLLVRIELTTSPLPRGEYWIFACYFDWIILQDRASSPVYPPTPCGPGNCYF
jgi:hypothetical protein